MSELLEKTCKIAVAIMTSLVAGVALFVFAYLVALATMSLSRHDWAELDFDSDGRTTVTEILEGADAGRRPVETTGGRCVEIYSFKDGLPLKVIC